MIDLLAQGAIVAAVSLIGGYGGAYLLVAVADAFGLVYSAEREARRHRDDDRHDPMEPVPARRLVPVMAWHLDLDDPAIVAAIAAPPVNRTPLADRIATARRLELTV